jgi:hypothetical protein
MRAAALFASTMSICCTSRPDVSTDHASGSAVTNCTSHPDARTDRASSCLDRPDVDEQWACLYDQEVHDFTNATRSGFAAPLPVVNEGADIVMHLKETTTIDWAHPIGFAVIDCDRKSTMLDGKAVPLSVEISWDTKRSCLHVSPVRGR